MSRVSSAKRYAKALFEVAKSQQALAEIKSNFSEFVNLLKENKDLESLLGHPRVAIEDKKQLLGDLLKETHPFFVKFVQLMVDKGREGLFQSTYEVFVQLVNEQEGIAEATVYSATPLGQGELDQVAITFSGHIGKQVRVTNVVDENLIGGIVVRIGDRLYDGSIRGKLNRLSKSISAQTL